MDSQTKTKAINLEDLQISVREVFNKGFGNSGTCTTAAATPAKEVTLGTIFSLVTGCTLLVKFTHGITSDNSTLAVTHTVDGASVTETAKPIYLNGAALEAGIIPAGAILILRYNGAQYDIIGGGASDAYTKAQTDTLLDGKVSNPIELTSLSSDYAFKEGDTIIVGTGLYKCTAETTTLPPFNFVFDEGGSIVIDSINGYEAVVVDSDTLNTGWEKVMDVSDRRYTEMRLSTKADKATTAAGYGIIDVYTKNQIDALTRHTRLMDFDLNTLKKAVADQNLEKYGLKVGDEKTINGHTYVIAGLNPMKGTSTPYRVTTNHVGLIVISHTRQRWNASGNTYEGADDRGAGYLNSDLHYYIKNTLLPLVNTDLGASNLIGHSKLLSNTINQSGVNKMGEATGCASNWTWDSNCKICALSEVQVYGAAICSSSLFDTGDACRQLEVFQKYSHTEIFRGLDGTNYENTWLRDVVSASNAAYADYNGQATRSPANSSNFVTALILFH